MILPNNFSGVFFSGVSGLNYVSGVFFSGVTNNTESFLSGFKSFVSGYRSFEESYKEIESVVEKKRYQWMFNASVMENFEDFKMQTLSHINKKWHLYDQNRSLGAWVNTVTSSQFKNKLRNIYLGTASPCNSCPCRQGDNLCSMFGEQKSSSCNLYMGWYDSNKRHKHLARMPLTMENHQNEVNSKPSDDFDIEAAAEELHVKIEPHLTESEWDIYRLLYIEHKSEDETVDILGLKKDKGIKNNRIRLVKKLIVKIAKEILANDGVEKSF